MRDAENKETPQGCCRRVVELESPKFTADFGTKASPQEPL